MRNLTPREQLNLAFVSDVNVLVDQYKQQEQRANETCQDCSANHFYNHTFAQIFYKYMLKGKMGVLVVDISDELHRRLSRYYAALTGKMKMSTQVLNSKRKSSTNTTRPQHLVVQRRNSCDTALWC